MKNYFNCEELKAKPFPTFKNNILRTETVIICEIILKGVIRKLGMRYIGKRDIGIKYKVYVNKGISISLIRFLPYSHIPYFLIPLFQLRVVIKEVKI